MACPPNGIWSPEREVCRAASSESDVAEHVQEILGFARPGVWRWLPTDRHARIGREGPIAPADDVSDYRVESNGCVAGSASGKDSLFMGSDLGEWLFRQAQGIVSDRA